MSIKSILRKLENQVCRINGNQTVSFEIPYCKEASQTKEIQRQIIKNNGLDKNDDVLVIFIVNFAKAA